MTAVHQGAESLQFQTPGGKTIIPVITVDTNGVPVSGGGGGGGGDASAAKQDIGNASLASIDAKTPALVGGATPVLVEAGSGPYSPGYDIGDEGGGPVQTDPDGQLRIRGPVLTDEGTFRCNFANTSLAVAIGNATFTNGSTAVAVALTEGTDLHAGDYIKLDTHAESAWAQVDSVDSLTGVTLVEPYTGANGSGAASRAIVRPTTGSGGSIAVASGQCVITSGTTDAALTGIRRLVDVAPLVFRSRVSVSQRIANQTVVIGMEEDAPTPRWFCRFVLDGTDATKVKTETGRNPTGAPSASEIESYTRNLPIAGTTATAHDYRIEFMVEFVAFYVDDILVSKHILVMPAQHDEVTAEIYVVNGTGAASSTTVSVDMVTGKNHNKLEAGFMSDSETVVANQPDSRLLTYSQAGVIAINTVLLQLDCSRIRSIDIQAISIGTTGVITPQQSLDGGTTWNAMLVSNLNSGAMTTTLTNGAAHRVQVGGGLFRLVMTTATTAGTTTIAMAASQIANPNPGMNINLTQISGASNNSGGFTGGLGVGGPVAHSAGASGNPVQVGGVVSTAVDTTLVASDMARHQMSTSGQLVTVEGAVPELSWSAAAVAGGITATTDTTVAAARAAGIRNYVKSMQVKNANAVATEFVIKDGASVIWRGHLSANMLNAEVITFDPPLRGTAATAVNVACITTGAQVYCDVQGYQGV